MTYVIPAVYIVFCLVWILLYIEIKKYLWIKSRATDAEMLSRMLDESTEKAVRLIEEQGITNKDINAKKRIEASQNILNDVLRERGLDVTKFMTKGLIEAKRHEILHNTRTAGEHRVIPVGKTPKGGGNGGASVPK